MSESVYSVHVARPDDVGAVEIVFRTEGEARAYAEDRSTDFHIAGPLLVGVNVVRLRCAAGAAR